MEFGLEDVERFDEAVLADRLLYLRKGCVHEVFSRLMLEEQAGQPVTRWDLAFDRDFLLSLYQRHNAQVRTHFRHRAEALLDLDRRRRRTPGGCCSSLG